jgi:hypothetical protein
MASWRVGLGFRWHKDSANKQWLSFPPFSLKERGKGWGTVAVFCCSINRAASRVGKFAGGFACAGAGEHVGLPSGRPAREAVLGGDPGGELGKRFRRTLMRECSLAWVGDHGEASADYLHRCHIRRKVARFFFAGPAKCRNGMKMGEMRHGWRDRRTAFLEASRWKLAASLPVARLFRQSE